MLEGDVKSELVRIDYPVIRIWEVDPHTRERTREFDLPFRPGPFEWGPGKPRPLALSPSELSRSSRSGCSGPPSSTEEVLSQARRSASRFVVKEHLPASVPAVAHVADPDGAPMARIGLQFKGPGMPTAQDAFRSEEDHWFATEKKFYRVVRSQPPGAARLFVCRPPRAGRRLPQAAGGRGAKGVARFRYQDRSGKSRVFDWALDGQQGKSVALPDSDLTVTLVRGDRVSDLRPARLDQVLGDDPIPIAVFKIQAGKDEPVTHMALANLPMVPNVIPPADESAKAPPRPLAAIHYMVPPTLDPKTQRPLRPDRGPGRSRTSRSTTASSAGARTSDRASSGPPGRWRRASRSSPSAATPTCR